MSRSLLDQNSSVLTLFFCFLQLKTRRPSRWLAQLRKGYYLPFFSLANVSGPQLVFLFLRLLIVAFFELLRPPTDAASLHVFEVLPLFFLVDPLFVELPLLVFVLFQPGVKSILRTRDLVL
jgi:hypothetical protein